MAKQTLYSFYKPHSRYTLDCGDHLITKQSHKAECDINTILSQYKKTGIINHINNASANYQDLPDNLDYQQSINTILRAQSAFAELPSVVRDHYQNNPEVFLHALGDPGQREQLEQWGVFKPSPKSPTPSPAPTPPAEPSK